MITIRCLLPLRRRLFLAGVLLASLFCVGPLLLGFLLILWPWWPALPAGGFPWRHIWPLLPALAIVLFNLLRLTRLLRQAALFTPETTLCFDKRARLLTISQAAPAVRSSTITVPFNAVQSVSADRWIQSGLHLGPADRWFLEIRCRDGRRFRTPATENSRVLETCARRIRNGALTTTTVRVSNPPQGYTSGVGGLMAMVLLASVLFFMLYSPFWSQQVFHQNGALAMARVQQKSSSGMESVQLRYTFALPSGRDIDASRSVDPQLAATLKEGDWMVVRYDRNEPADNVPVVEGKRALGPPLGFSILWLVFLLVPTLADQLAAASPGKPWGLWPRDGWC